MLKKLEAEVSQLKPKITKQLWTVIQSGALVCAIIAPVLFKVDSQRPRMTQSVAIREITLPIERKEHLLSSEVLHLPSPLEMQPDSDLHYEFQAKQIRFESRGGTQRSLASIRGSIESWKLARLERLEADGSKIVFDLFENEEREVSSSFVELSEGENVYLVTFLDARRHEKKIRVRIKHFKKSDPS